MKNFALMAAALVLGFTLNIGDAEAKRLGGGGSYGMQRQSVSPNKAPDAARAPSQAAPAAAAAPAAQPNRSWMGPIAGLAAGLGLAALASHLGFGEGLANMMMIGLLILGAVMLFRFFSRKKAAVTESGLQYAGAGYGGNNIARPDFTPAGGSASEPVMAASSTGNIPADFDLSLIHISQGIVR